MLITHATLFMFIIGLVTASQDGEVDVGSKHFTAITMSLIAGLSTGIVVGGFIVMFLGRPSEKTIGAMLGFASGVMLFVSFVHLVPETAEKIGWQMAVSSFLAGVVFFYFVIKLIPEPDPSKFEEARTQDNKGTKKVDAKLLMTGIVVATGMALHNFPEGMAVYLSTLKHYNLGLAIALAIGLHNIPEGMAVAVTMYAATKSKWQALKYSFLSGLCEPLGAIMFGLLFYGWLSETAVYFMLGSVAGVMTYICFAELISNALTYCGVTITVISNVVGMIVLFLSSIALEQFEEH
ncbi:zntB [Acrasis kona]|uniref:ZntB n=1 Tax=Acrasis kona TaxID=1008807 RepID=A0AAW2Z916_9EUKA